MDNRLDLRDYSLLIPLLIGFLSILGICVILISIWLPRQKTQAIPTPTLVLFKHQLLATLTPVPTIQLEAAAPTELPPPTANPVDLATLSPSLTEATGIATAEDFFTPTVTITPNPIFTASPPLTAGTYDDADPRIIRSGNWTAQADPDAYQQTLLVSNTVDNYLAFSFVGYQLALGYLSSADAGDMTVNIDGVDVTITQLVGNVWYSQELDSGTHFVRLTHTSGRSINLDYVEIP